MSSEKLSGVFVEGEMALGSERRKQLDEDLIENDSTAEINRNEAQNLGKMTLAISDMPEEGKNEEKAAVEGGYSEEEESRLREACFTRVDHDAVSERVREYAEKVELAEFYNLLCTLEEDKEKGLQDAVKYASDILDLRRMGRIGEAAFSEELEPGTLGSCRYDMDSGCSDILVRKSSTSVEIIETVMHESWHAWQNRRIGEYRVVERFGLGIDNERQRLGEMYAYNSLHYVESSQDYDGYKDQLLEVEAFAFEEQIHAKLVEVSEVFYCVTILPDIYTEDNRENIAQVVATVLNGLDVNRLVNGMGLASLTDLLHADLTAVNIPQIMTELLKLVEIDKSAVVNIVDGAKNDGEEMLPLDEYDKSELIIDPGVIKGNNYMILNELAKQAWGLRQAQSARNNTPRGEAYQFNREHAIPKNGVGYNEQLLVAERRKFADDLLRILNEQMSLDDARTEELSLEAAEDILSVVDAFPEKSLEYRVKGTKGKIEEVKRRAMEVVASV